MYTRHLSKIHTVAHHFANLSRKIKSSASLLSHYVRSHQAQCNTLDLRPRRSGRPPRSPSPPALSAPPVPSSDCRCFCPFLRPTPRRLPVFPLRSPLLPASAATDTSTSMASDSHSVRPRRRTSSGLNEEYDDARYDALVRICTKWLCGPRPRGWPAMQQTDKTLSGGSTFEVDSYLVITCALHLHHCSAPCPETAHCWSTTA